jgi:hypothetical protein
MVTDGTSTTVVTVVVAPFEVVSVTETVSVPETLGAGTVAETVSVAPLEVVSVKETVTAGTETVPPLLVVTETDG